MIHKKCVGSSLWLAAILLPLFVWPVCDDQTTDEPRKKFDRLFILPQMSFFEHLRENVLKIRGLLNTW